MTKNDKVFKVRVEYEDVPIRHIAIQCPFCKKWFMGYDITINEDELKYDYDIGTTIYKCPVCDEEFGGFNDFEEEIELSSYPDIYNGCLHKKVTWE